MNAESIYKELVQKFDRYSIEDDLSLKSRLRVEIINALKNCKPLESKHFHLWGLTLYFSGYEPQREDLLKAIEKFKSSLELEPDNFLSQLYMAHCYHDLKEYKNALSNYLKVNKEKLKELQYWRYVKLLEQIGFSYYKTGTAPIAHIYFEQLLIEYKSHLKPFMLPYPSELKECLGEQHEITKTILELMDK